MSAPSQKNAGTLNIAALMAQRESQDAMFFSVNDAKASPEKAEPSLQHSQELVIKKKDNQSDIDIILGGD